MSKVKLGIQDNKTDMIRCKGAFDASVVLPAHSGRFVVPDASDSLWKAAPNDTSSIGGYVEQNLTTSAVAGGTVLSILSVRDRVFELPYAAAGAAATLTEAVLAAIKDKLIDLYVDAAGIQYADNAATQAILRVEGGNVDENTLYVSVIDSAIHNQA